MRKGDWRQGKRRSVEEREERSKEDENEKGKIERAEGVNKSGNDILRRSEVRKGAGKRGRRRRRGGGGGVGREEGGEKEEEEYEVR
jgi:hypothetical protein